MGKQPLQLNWRNDMDIIGDTYIKITKDLTKENLVEKAVELLG